ncbi:MAG: ParB N-terminal domain-containing protein [Desulfotomaculales bacterium]
MGREIVVLPEVERCLFPLKPEEYRALRASIEREGVRQPIVVWPQNGRLVLVDGHNRWRIARELGLECPVAEREFGSLEAEPDGRAVRRGHRSDLRAGEEGGHRVRGQGIVRWSK